MRDEDKTPENVADATETPLEQDGASEQDVTATPVPEAVDEVAGNTDTGTEPAAESDTVDGTDTVDDAGQHDGDDAVDTVEHDAYTGNEPVTPVAASDHTTSGENASSDASPAADTSPTVEDITGKHIGAWSTSDEEAAAATDDAPDHALHGARMPAERLGDDDETSPQDENKAPSVARSNEYFQDDEEYLEEVNDRSLYETSDLGMFQQEEGTVSWELVNFRKDSGRPRGRISLHNDAPILRIHSSDGQAAEFVLTQHFAKSLSASMDTVHKAYFGIDAVTEQKTAKEKIQGVGDWMSDHKVLSGIIITLLLFIVVSALL